MLEIQKKIKMPKYAKYFLSFCLFLFFLFVFGTNEARGASATLFLSPPSGTYNFGDTFSVSVMVNTGGETINAADGTLVFNSAELSVVSVSKSNSIFTMWTTEPAFSKGSIVFGGGTPANFTGSSGTIIKITFKTKAVATAQANFSSGSVLAADGKGTNILATMSGGTYIIKATSNIPPTQEVPPEEEPTPPSTPDEAPAAPIVSSTSHPDPEKWYSNNDPEFSWKLPDDVTGVSLLLDKESTTNPGNVSDGLTESKNFEDVEDGIWYFHIKFKNEYGWGKITHREVLIDTVPPLPFEVEVQKEDSTDPQPTLLFETTDETSGIERYEVKIDAETFPVNPEEIKDNPYKLPPQPPGKHIIEIKAFDKAGNYALASVEIEISPIEKPIITKYPKRLSMEEHLTLEGSSLPNITIKVFIQGKGKEIIKEETISNEKGEWAFTYSKTLEKGNYEAWVQAKDIRGSLSLPSEKISFKVDLPPFIKFGKIAIDYLTIVITLIVLIIGALAVIFYAWYRVSVWRKKMRAETKELSQAVYGAFRALREEVQEQIEYLDGEAGLTPGEKKVRDKLKEALDISEKFIGKEIKDVEKELE